MLRPSARVLRRLAHPLTRARDSRGQALLELAIILFPAMVLLGGAVDLGRLFYAKITIADAAREGALWAAQHPNSWMQGCDASQAISGSNPDQVTCHARNEAAAGFVTIRTTDVTCSSTPKSPTPPAYTPCSSNSPGEGGTVYVYVAGTFTTLMGGLTFNLDTMAVGRIVQMPSTASAASQTITFGALANQDIGVGSVTVSATASSGLTVTFTTTTPSICTSSGADGSVILILAVGTCTVVADQPGDGHWAPAPSVSQSFQVTGAPPPPPGGQTITFPSMSDRQLGSGSALASATASSGLQVTFTTTTPAVCTPFGPDGSTITLLAVGLCTVQADQAGNASYSAAPSVFQSFNVTPATPPSCAAPTITFTISPSSGTAYKNPGRPGTTFTFNANASTIQANCHPVWSWNFGNASGTSSTPFQTTYVYPSSPGTNHVFTVTLIVTVDGGLSGQAQRTVTVSPG